MLDTANPMTTMEAKGQAAMKIVGFASALEFLRAEGVPFEDPREADGSILVQKVCDRCGGSGAYSYNPTDKDRCFGCTALKPPAPSKWKARENAVDFARKEKAKKAKRARVEKERAADAAKQAAFLEKQKSALANVDAIIADLVAQLMPLVGPDGKVSDWSAFGKAVNERRRAECLPEALEVLDEHGNVETHENVFHRVKRLVLSASRAKAGASRGYLGEVGKALEGVFVVKAQRDFERQSARPWGGMETAYAITLADDAGNVIVTFAGHPLNRVVKVDGGEQYERVEPGERVSIKARVKRHARDRDGVPETTVTHLKLV